MKPTVGGSRFFVRPSSEIPKIEESPPPPILEPEQPELNFHLIGKGKHVATRLCLDAMDVEHNGIQVWGDFFENKRVIRIEGSYPGWRLVRSISAEQAAEMVENICVFLEAAGDLKAKI